MVHVSRGATRFALLLALAFQAAFAAAERRAIQAGAYQTVAEAQAAAASLSETCSPVRIRTIADGSAFPHKVIVGSFRNYMEAWAYRALLDSPALTGVFIVSDPGDSPAAAVRLPIRRPVVTDGLDDPEPTDAEIYYDAARLRGPDSMDGGPETSEELETSIAEAPSAPVSNRYRLSLVRKYARTGNADRVYQLAETVKQTGSAYDRVMADYVLAHAEGRLNQRTAATSRFASLTAVRSVPASLRRDCVRRAAAHHHMLRQYPQAFMAFQALVDHSPVAAEHWEAKLQQAGLGFELVSAGKGTWNEVRDMLREIAESPAAPRAVRATAELMELETLWEERRLAEALAAADLFVQEYPDITRERTMADLWRGIILCYMRRFTESRAVLERLAGETIAAADKFAGVEPRARAASWIAFSAHKQGDLAARDYWSQVLRSEFPDSEQTRRLDTMFR